VYYDNQYQSVELGMQHGNVSAAGGGGAQLGSNLQHFYAALHADYSKQAAIAALNPATQHS
jgi:hypothetical protein